MVSLHYTGRERERERERERHFPWHTECNYSSHGWSRGGAINNSEREKETEEKTRERREEREKYSRNNRSSLYLLPRTSRSLGHFALAAASVV